MDFLHFIKKESEKRLNKLFEYSNKNTHFKFNSSNTEDFNNLENNLYINNINSKDNNGIFFNNNIIINKDNNIKDLNMEAFNIINTEKSIKFS